MFGADTEDAAAEFGYPVLTAGSDHGRHAAPGQILAILISSSSKTCG